jgi:hypothetical protein
MAAPGFSDFRNKFKMEQELRDNALRGVKGGQDASCQLCQSFALTPQNLGWKRRDYSRGWQANLPDGLRRVKADVLMTPSRTDDSARPEYEVHQRLARAKRERTQTLAAARPQ